MVRGIESRGERKKLAGSKERAYREIKSAAEWKDLP